jgi:transcriptional regulator with XRE-family HTH domain
MHQPLGEHIRQLRRQYSLTQTELGDERFSKSYVSAVERGKITPSHDALQFFAEQLGQSSDYFEQVNQQIESVPSVFPLTRPFLPTADDRDKQEKAFILLDMLLENAELRCQQLLQRLPVLSSGELATLPADKQARYSFWRGNIAQEKGDTSTALKAFEYALALASPKDQPAILDSLGMCHYLAHDYHMALSYHRRALHTLEEEAISRTASTLRLKVEFHCAEDYRTMGAHKQAVVHYESARHYLNAAHDLKIAGQIYEGLGYCTYASFYQKEMLLSSSFTQTAIEEAEQAFQHATDFLADSRTLYQVSNDSAAESITRLTQAMVLLDLCAQRRYVAQEKGESIQAPIAANYATLLDEAKEQCNQVLINGQSRWLASNAPSTKLKATLYLAMAYLIRILVEQAALARHSGYTDKAMHERARAAFLCQRAFTAFAEQTLFWTLIQEIMNMQTSDGESQTESLPDLSNLSLPSGLPSSTRISQAELYFAAGALAEELGDTAASAEYMDRWYMQADQYFQAALTLLRSALQEQQSDQTYLTRCYQRYINILEERVAVYAAKPTLHMQSLLNVLKDALLQLQSASELPPLQG